MDRTIKPGQGDTLKVTLQSKGRSTGPVSKSIAIATNDPANQQTTLWCKGQVRGPFRDLYWVVAFDPIERTAGPQSKTIALHRGDGGPISPEVIPVKTEGVKTALREVKPGEHYELDVTLSPPWPNGRINELITIKTGVAEMPEHSVHVTADVTPRVGALPDRFTIALQRPEARDYPVVVMWEKNASQKAVDAQVDDPQLSVGIEEKQNVQRVVLHVPAGYQRSGADPVVTVRTDDAEVPEFTVPIAFVQAPERTTAKAASRPARPPRKQLAKPARPNASPAQPGQAPRPEPAPGPDKPVAPETTPPTDKTPAPEKTTEPDKTLSPEKAPQPEKPKDEGT